MTNMSTGPTPRYRCTACAAVIETGDSEPVCNATDRCGFLFDTDRIPEPTAPARRALKFQLTDIPDGGYQADDERTYDVLHHGRIIGTIERCWLLPRTAGDPPPAGWAFQSADRRYSGEGRTRADAVIAAYEGNRP
jgi:hypothetical protein